MKHLILILSTFLVMQAYSIETNYHFSHTDSTSATSDKIWAIWTDVPNWKHWDLGLKESYLEGPFAVGTKGKLIPDKGPKSKFQISEIEPLKSYTFKTKIPFGWLIIKRSLDEREGKTFFKHEVKFTGLFKKLFGNKLGKKYRVMLPKVMQEIKQIAENK